MALSAGLTEELVSAFVHVFMLVPSHVWVIEYGDVDLAGVFSTAIVRLRVRPEHLINRDQLVTMYV